VTTDERADSSSRPQRTNLNIESVTDAGDIPRQLRRRRAASYRLPAFCGCGHRDPLTHRVAPDGPSTFGLDEETLRRHANDLVLRYGWSVDEVMTVLIVTLRAAS
jgi:hypothetical protein